ncbi:MAG: hypothetical protein ACJATA_001481 [Sphingobacteriales bacterium]|jgi:hypothetical protein
MKRFLSLIAVVAFAATAFGQGQRLVLLEHFTQASCGPCATYNPAVEELFNENNAQTQKIIAVKYQTSWPGTDPMYTHNPQDPNARVAYYGVSGVPNSVIDGNHYNGHPAQWGQDDIDTRYAVPAEVDITMDHEFLTDDTIMVTITIDPVVQTVASDLVAHINVVERKIVFGSAPGSNGETEFYYVTKKMLPSNTGTALPDTLKVGEPITIVEKWKMKNVYDQGQIAAVSFVQNNANKDILNAGYSPTKLDAKVSEPSIFAGANAEVSFDATFSSNIGDTTVMVIDFAGSDVPEGWVATFSYGDSSYGMNETFEISMAKGEDVVVTVNATTNDEAEVANFQGRMTIKESPVNFISAKSTVFGKVKNLYVDIMSWADAAAFTAGFNAASNDFLQLTVSEFDGIEDTKLNVANVKNIFWNSSYRATPGTGTDGLPTISPSQIAKLSKFMDEGGNLFITGATIAQQANQGIPGIADFMETYLGAKFVKKGNSNAREDFKDNTRDDIFNIPQSSVYARAINPVAIDYVTTVNKGVPVISNYSDGSLDVMIRNRGEGENGFKAVYVSYMVGLSQGAFVSILSNEIFRTSIAWFDGDVDQEDEFTGVKSLALESTFNTYPNPATDVLNIEMDVVPSKALVNVYDVNGKLVMSSDITSNVTSLNVKDLSAGTFTYNVTSGTKISTTQKFVVVK